jgi:hypothetical protein
MRSPLRAVHGASSARATTVARAAPWSGPRHARPRASERPASPPSSGASSKACGRMKVAAAITAPRAASTQEPTVRALRRRPHGDGEERGRDAFGHQRGRVRHEARVQRHGEARDGRRAPRREARGDALDGGGREGGDDGVHRHRDERRSAEEPVRRGEQRGVADGVMRDVRHGPIGPQPRVAMPAREAQRELVVIDAVPRWRKAPRRPRRDAEARGEGGGEHPDRVVAEGRGRAAHPRVAPFATGNRASSPVRSSALTTSHAGSPTTFAYEPSMRATAKAPMPCTAYAPALSRCSPVAT